MKHLVSAIAAFALLACSPETGAAGDACVRTAQCGAGLACLEGLCSDDLDRVADPDAVPDLQPDPPSDAGADEDAGGD
ncbi:MAG: hypothetical protein PVI30_08195 [Myxococcales bacterium]